MKVDPVQIAVGVKLEVNMGNGLTLNVPVNTLLFAHPLMPTE